ncbi:unnamed protein product [Soboliphyme baturini]|uniref:Endo/exonuclease/phosphatase domain-containing protein n=1 Tax=Soboliphyme baturini TaxID=241478 RepID=A0A183J8S0_9BILA|nr:unnamed protein product [Soboliphyme baturini]
MKKMDEEVHEHVKDLQKFIVGDFNAKFRPQQNNTSPSGPIWITIKGKTCVTD